jgi:competence ComEA-like helix-hairpin-helix protein
MITSALALAALVITFTAGAAESGDPNWGAVQVVCGRCHTTALFRNQLRSWSRWNDVFEDMMTRGATGTDDELVQVTSYFLENLTVVNVNTSPADELGGVLGVKESVAEAIIARREKKPFANLAELRQIPGVDANKLQQRKERILF